MIKAHDNENIKSLNSEESRRFFGLLWLVQLLLIFLTLAPVAQAQMNLLVTNQGDNSVSAYDNSGAYLGRFVAPGSGGLKKPGGMVLAQNGHLWVVSQDSVTGFNKTGLILQYNGISGQYMKVALNTQLILNSPYSIVRAPNDLILVSASAPPMSGNPQNITGFRASDSAWVWISDYLTDPIDMAMGPDNNVYVVDQSNTTIFQIDGVNGHIIKPFINLGIYGTGSHELPIHITFGPDGNLYASHPTMDLILKYNGVSGDFMGVFSSGNNLSAPKGLVFGPDGHLYVVSAGNSAVLKFDGTTGAFLSNFVAPNSPTLVGPAKLIFVPSTTNPVPVAISAGDVYGTTGGIKMTLDGSPSFAPYQRPLTYKWSQVGGPSVALDLSNASHPFFLSPNSVPKGGTTYSFQLIVNDGISDSAPIVINAVVDNVNYPPIADAGINQIVKSEAQVTLDASASYDNEQFNLYYYWIQESGPNVSLSNSESIQPTFTAPAVGSGSITLTFRVYVSDGYVQVASTNPVTITVQASNQTPIAFAGDAMSFASNSTARLDGSQSLDPDGDPLTYKWIQVSGPTITLDTADPARPSFKAPNVTNLTNLVFSLVVNDGQTDSTPSSVTLTIVPARFAPTCKLAKADIPILWPPNHRLRKVEIKNVIPRNAQSRNTLSITGITQDEPTSGLGNGDTAIDGFIKGSTAFVRGERKDTGDGRVYKVNFKATNTTYNLSCTGSVTICVPVKPGRNGNCKDSGQVYNSLK